MSLKRNSIIAAVGLALTLGSVVSASAESRWEYNHPRRDQVVDRLHNQSLRIRDERREGEISARQAINMHREDRAIFHQEQFAARHNGGRITRTEQRAFNQEENGVSRQIGR